MCLAINIARFAHLLKRVNFNAIVDHLALMHIVKSKVEPATVRIERLLEMLSFYSFNLYNIKRKDMILSNFLSRQKHNDSNQHEIILILFNMHVILQTRYYNLGKDNPVKYLPQTQSQAKFSGIKLPDINGVGKRLDPNVQQEKQIIKLTALTKMTEVSQIKPRLGQGRAGLRCKIKTPIPINKPIVQAMEKQPKVLAPKPPKIQA